MSFAPSYTKSSVWLWACCHLSPSFISTVFDNFENIPFLLSAALCHICLSCKLLQISAVSGSAAQGSAALFVSNADTARCLMSGWESPALAPVLQSLLGTIEAAQGCPGWGSPDHCSHTRGLQVLISSHSMAVCGVLWELACLQGCAGCFGWPRGAAAASCPCDAQPLLPFAFCCCAGLS